MGGGSARAVQALPPVDQSAVTHEFKVGDQEGTITVDLYPNGNPCGITIRLDKTGSSLMGFMDSFCTAVSIGLQHGLPLKMYCDRFSGRAVEPTERRTEKDPPAIKSIPNYVFRWLEQRFLSAPSSP